MHQTRIDEKRPKMLRLTPLNRIEEKDAQKVMLKMSSRPRHDALSAHDFQWPFQTFEVRSKTRKPFSSRRWTLLGSIGVPSSVHLINALTAHDFQCPFQTYEVRPRWGLGLEVRCWRLGIQTLGGQTCVTQQAREERELHATVSRRR